MIATAVPTRRREVLAIDMTSVLRLPRPFVNPPAKIYGGFLPDRPVPQLAAAQRDQTGPDYLVRSWYSFKEAIPKRVAPVKTMIKITAPNEKRVVSDI